MSTEFPNINGCLICEEIRPEQSRKLTVLGLYGMAPHVNILFKDINAPIERLCFLLMMDKGRGWFSVSFEIVDENGISFVQSPRADFEIEDHHRYSNIGISAAGLKFPHPGKYTFKLLVNGKNHYECNFEIGQATDADFR